ncbi:MAG TPA: hypothetical protein VL125_02810, partial [Pelobium sp.]|nr:hypothetical protein [Pelobium sp.]
FEETVTEETVEEPIAEEDVQTEEPVQETENIEETVTEEIVEEPIADEEIQTEEPVQKTENFEETVTEEIVEEPIAEEEIQTEEPVQETENIEETVTEEIVEEPIAEEEIQTEEPVQKTENFEETVTEEIVEEPTSKEEPANEGHEKPTEKDELIFESPVASDFFAFAKSEKPDPQPVASASEQSKEEKPETKTKEDISQYNDERLPYTFLWWLNKTRKEYASNTQPYVKANKPASVKKEAPVEQSLNHQIAENIFHLRGADEIGSTNMQNQTVPFDFRRKEFQIIEKFIKEEPQIKPPAPNKIDTENKAKKSSEDANQVVSETLAKIYVEQMLYHKALDVYKKLSLKYPEKSTYFASQIKYLELKVN